MPDERRDRHEEHPSPGLTGRVLDAARPELARLRRRAWMRRLSVPCALAAVLLVAWNLRTGVATPSPAAPAGTGWPSAWLQSSLGPDGTWGADTFTGPPADTVGMHAMALLALASVQAPGQPGGAEHLRRGASWLLRQQGPDGSVGRPLPSGAFDHPLGTLALLETWHVTGDASVRRAAGRAIEHLASHAGSVAGPASNVGLSAWSLQALMRARELGFPGLDDPVARARSRLSLDLAPGREQGPLNLPAVRSLALGKPDERRTDALGPLYAASIAILDG